MATRNLTKKFVDIRNAAKANRALNVRSTFELGESDSYSDREQLRVGFAVIFDFIAYC